MVLYDGTHPDQPDYPDRLTCGGSWGSPLSGAMCTDTVPAHPSDRRGLFRGRSGSRARGASPGRDGAAGAALDGDLARFHDSAPGGWRVPPGPGCRAGGRSVRPAGDGPVPGQHVSRPPAVRGSGKAEAAGPVRAGSPGAQRPSRQPGPPRGSHPSPPCGPAG